MEINETNVQLLNSAEKILKEHTSIMMSEIITKMEDNNLPYHNMDHVLDILKQMKNKNRSNNKRLTLAALFHDIIYVPSRTDNEERSAEFFESVFTSEDTNLKDRVKSMIMVTKTLTPSIDIEKEFLRYDWDILFRSFDELIIYENKIAREFSFVMPLDYNNKRIEFLNRSKIILNDLFGNTDSKVISNINKLIEYIQNKDYKMCFFVDDFTIFHKGHKEIVKRLENTFDKVILVMPEIDVYIPEHISNNYSIIKTNTPYQHINSLNYNKAVIIKAIYENTDIINERNKFYAYSEMNPKQNLFFIYPSVEFSHLTDKTIRELHSAELLEKWYWEEDL